MGRTIVAEENVQAIVKSLAVQQFWRVGLVIGQNTAQKDLVCHLACTPNEASNHSNKPTKSEKQTNTKKPKSIEELDDTWVAQHAKQVVRMLPGGIEVLGIFVIYPIDNLQPSHLSKLKQVLLAVFKLLSKQVQIPPQSEFNEKMVLHVCPSSEKVTAKTFDIANIQSSAKPADFKYSQGSSTWHRFDCRFALDLSLHVTEENAKLSVLKQINTCLSPFYTSLSNAIVLIDGRLRKLDDLLDESKDSRRSKSKEKTNQLVNHSVDVFMDMFLHSNTTNADCIVEKCGVKLDVRGTLQSRAFVHGRATAAEAFQAIKQDIIRSMMARCEIHFEDLLMVDEEQLDPHVVHEPPRRVFAHLPNSDITVSDYLFPGEKARDSLDAYQELLSLLLRDDEIEFDCERLPEATDLTKTPSEKGSSSSDVITLNSVSKSTTNFLVIGLSIAVAILAISLAYLLLRG